MKTGMVQAMIDGEVLPGFYIDLGEELIYRKHESQYRVFNGEVIDTTIGGKRLKRKAASLIKETAAHHLKELLTTEEEVDMNVPLTNESVIALPKKRTLFDEDEVEVIPVGKAFKRTRAIDVSLGDAEAGPALSHEELLAALDADRDWVSRQIAEEAKAALRADFPPSPEDLDWEDPLPEHLEGADYLTILDYYEKRRGLKPESKPVTPAPYRGSVINAVALAMVGIDPRHYGYEVPEAVWGHVLRSALGGEPSTPEEALRTRQALDSYRHPNERDGKYLTREQAHDFDNGIAPKEKN